MFWVAPWDLGEAVVGCQQQYAGTTPRPFSAALAYGSRAALPAASNLILSNGRLDPWSSGGVTAPVPGAPASVLVLFIDESAHHLDLRASDPSDPAPVVAARSAEDQAMLGWLREHYEGRGVAVPAGVARAATRMR